MRLYKEDSNGKIRLWEIYQKGEDSIFWSHGILGGEMQHESKNIDPKANRTMEEQIELEMNSKIEKRKNSGYVDNIKNISESNRNQMGFLRPMLAYKMKKGMEIEYKNCYVQRKYDGHRCLITNDKGCIRAYSRGGKPISSIDHIIAAIGLEEGTTVDGELYLHGLKLQEISSMVRKQGVQAPELEYIIYDKMSENEFIHRIADVIEMRNSGKILMAPTISVQNMKEIEGFFMQFRAEGYEGLIIRHGKNGYQYGKRSKFLIKMKAFDDAEFEVVSILSSVEGWAILVCVTKKGRKFRCSAPGSVMQKTDVLDNKEQFIGRFVTVEYAGLTLDGKPSQPIAKCWRDEK